MIVHKIVRDTAQITAIAIASLDKSLSSVDLGVNKPMVPVGLEAITAIGQSFVD